MKKWPVLVLILLLLGWHLAAPINLTRSDLGRHIKNGELITHGVWDVLYKNYYSFVCPDYPFINHHWLFGVFCYTLWHYFDFSGLALVYLVLQLINFLLFFNRLERFSTFALKCAFALLSIPLLASRPEIRPEAVSILFCGLFWCLFDLYQQQRLKAGHLKGWLCLVQVIWVNTHVFFILGPLLTVLFWGQAKINGDKEFSNTLKDVFLLTASMCLLNPSGIWGAVDPFNIFNSTVYYPTSEVRSIFFILKIYPNKIYYYFLVTPVLAILPWYFVIRREGVKKHIFFLVLMVVLSIGAMKYGRLIGLYGYFWIPLTSYAWGQWLQDWPAVIRKVVTVFLILVGVLVSLTIGVNWKQKPVLGLASDTERSMEFFKKERISGKIFNNFDIGPYLIFYLSPQRQFFVDSRPEAYPQEFFNKIYIPMQADEAAWHVLDKQCNFDVLYMSPEYNSWWRIFFTQRLKDPKWALVYIDNNAVIFLKRNERNAEVIQRYGWTISLVDPGVYKFDKPSKI